MPDISVPVDIFRRITAIAEEGLAYCAAIKMAVAQSPDQRLVLTPASREIAKHAGQLHGELDADGNYVFSILPLSAEDMLASEAEAA